MAIDTTDPSTLDDPGYLFNKRRTTENYAIGKTANTYATSMEAQRSQRANAQLDYTYKRAADNNAWAGANRGFDNQGGTQLRANEAYGQARNTAYQGAANNHDQNMHGIQESYNTMTRNKDNALQGYDLNEAERKSNLATQLRNAKIGNMNGSAGGAGAGPTPALDPSAPFVLGNSEGKGAGGAMYGQEGTGTKADPYIARPFAEAMDGSRGTQFDEYGRPVYADDTETLDRLRMQQGL